MMLIRIQHLTLAQVLSKVLSSVFHLIPTRKPWETDAINVSDLWMETESYKQAAALVG